MKFRSLRSGRERLVAARRPLTPSERQTNLFQGAALTLLPAIFLLPLSFFLLRAPNSASGRTLAALAFSVVAGLVLQGIRKLVRAMNLAELDLTTATAFAVLVVLSCLLMYAGVVLFAVFSR